MPLASYVAIGMVCYKNGFPTCHSKSDYAADHLSAYKFILTPLYKETVTCQHY